MQGIGQFRLDPARPAGHFIAGQNPIGPLANIGPAAHGGNPALQRIDITAGLVKFGNPRRDKICPEIAAFKVLPKPRDKARMHIRAARTKIGQRARLPEPAH